MSEQKIIVCQHAEIEYDPIRFVWRCAKCKKSMPIKAVWAKVLGGRGE